jgi:hypothetical protein
VAYSALVRRLLISCPGDVPAHDLAVVHKAINRWNGIYGTAFSAVIVPISWGTHAAAEFGQPPQDILNKQLVDECDICLALFANRLGTPTRVAESGTAEEIERFGRGERYVGILQSRRQVDASRIELEQAKKLEAYLASMRENALILEYENDDELSQRVDTILVSAVSRDQGRTALHLHSSTRVAEVWPRIDSSEKIQNLPQGRTVTTREWYLVLSNTGDAPARNVRVKIESSWIILGDRAGSEPEVEVLAPHSEVRFRVSAGVGDAMQARCIVSWTDERGNQQNSATVRLT